MQRALALWATAALLAVAAGGAPAAAACAAPAPRARFPGGGALSQLEHEVSGRVGIAPDGCAIVIDDFTYDGLGPEVFLYWGASCSASDLRRGGRLSAELPMTRVAGAARAFPLDGAPPDWAGVGCIAVWCEAFKANFGSAAVEFAGPGARPSPAAPSPSPPLASAGPSSPSSPGASPEAETAAAPALTAGLVNAPGGCLELDPRYLNLRWAVAGDEVTLGLEGRPGAGDRWLGFGFSPPGAAGVEMVGADALVAGVVGGECFALNFRLSERSQCDFITGAGVCPALAAADPPPGGPVELLACEADGDRLAVTARRALGDWPLDGSRPAVWAMGPVSEGSNSTVPVPLYHLLNLPGAAAPRAVNAPTGADFTVSLGTPTTAACAALPSGGAEGPVAGVPVAATIDAAPGNLFEFTIGPNPNYPNPPGWGLAYHVNGVETPALRVARGQTYTLRVAGGATHPLYITNSSIGGGAPDLYAGEQVFAGGEAEAGTAEAPAEFAWTVPADAPAELYYQCAVHQKLGWKLLVGDGGGGGAAAAAQPSAAACALEGLGGAPRAFAACVNVAGAGVRLHFTLSLNASNGTTLRGGLVADTAAAGAGWAGLGFPLQPGTMLGSKAIVVRGCAACASGAAVDGYQLLGYETSANVPGSFPLRDAAAARAPDGRLVAAFTVDLPLAPAELAAEPVPAIYALGPLNAAGDGLAPHAPGGFPYGATTLDFSRAGAAAAETAGAKQFGSKERAHAWLMGIGWTIFCAGAAAARALRAPAARRARPSAGGGLSRAGFQAHRAAQVVGFACVLAAFVLILVAVPGKTRYTTHRDLGIAAFALASAQVTALAARPALTSGWRRPWALAHHWVGRAALALGVANVYVGMLDVMDAAAWAVALYSAALGATLAAFVAAAAWDWRRGARARGAARGAAAQPPAGTDGEVPAPAAV